MSEPPFPKLKVPPKPQPSQKKKKKNASDRPQPTWLFPPDNENPVLNPTAKTEDEIMKERQDRAKSLDYMKRRVHAAPDRPAPPPQLLTLIGIFLTDFGFNSTSRLFTNERKGRQTLNGWEDAIGKKIEKGTPTLEKIYRDWYRDWKVGRKDETSSSESDSNVSSDDGPVNVTMEARGSSDDDSEASSDGFGGSDVDTKEPPRAKKGKATKRPTKKTAASSSSESSTSDSDADDEEGAGTQPKKATKSAVLPPTKPTVTAMINKLKRKAPASSSDSDSSEEEKSLPVKKMKIGPVTSSATTSIHVAKSAESSESSSSSSESEAETKIAPVNVPAKAAKSAEVAKGTKAKPVTKPAKSKLPTKSATQAESSDSSDSSDSDSASPGVDDGPASKQTNGVALPKIAKASSDSSVTISGDVKPQYSSATSSSAESSTSSSESDSLPPAKKAASAAQPQAQKKHQGAKPTPLAELSAQATTDSHVSNAYQPYDYAERAYQDLSVTRGKGFTKEKNKKKRGSYRGGAIDTAGGKGFKFED